MQGDTLAGSLSVLGCPFVMAMRGLAYGFRRQDEFHGFDWAAPQGSAGVSMFHVPKSIIQE